MAENLCYTAMTKFKAKYGEIPNVSDKKFFTNSVHVPVWEEVTPFEKIDVESQLDSYSSAGCILYTEFDATVKHNLDALETVVNYAMDHDVPYFAVNVPNDTCVDCGYCDEINDSCPQCGGHNIERLRRVTGYITGNYVTFVEDETNELGMSEEKVVSVEEIAPYVILADGETLPQIKTDEVSVLSDDVVQLDTEDALYQYLKEQVVARNSQITVSVPIEINNKIGPVSAMT